MRFKIAIAMAFAIFSLQAWAQVTINVLNKSNVYQAYYTITYSNYGVTTSLGELTIDGGGVQAKTVPAGATNINIKLRYAAFIGIYKDLKTISAGRTGGTVTFTGSLISPNADWAPDDASSGVGTEDNANIDVVYPNGDAELHRTARDGNGTQMQSLIDKGSTRVNLRNNRGFTPLHEAVQSGFGAGVDILLRAGADMNVQNNLGETPFVMALGLGKMDIAQKFVANGYPAASDAKAMETAVKKRNDAMVKFLLDNGADPNAALNQSLAQNNFAMVDMVMLNYAPTLNIAIYQKTVDARRFDIAKRIIESNIDVNAALDYAILKNTPDLIQPCLDKGADPQKVLKYAISQRKTDLVAAAVNNGANPTLVLDDAIKLNQVDIVRLLLDNNADADAGLTSALTNGKTTMIPLFLDKGAKVSNAAIAKVAASGDNQLLPKLIEAGGNKDTALAASMKAGKYQTAEMLVQAGATAPNLLKFSVETKQKNLMIAALDAGADPNPGLAFALSNGMNDYAELLYKAGAKTNDVNVVNAVIGRNDLVALKMMLQNQTGADLGMPAAINAKNTIVVKLLLENGATATPPQFITAAAKNKDFPMVDMLVKAGANPQNALPESVKGGDVTTVKYLLGAGADGRNVELLKIAASQNNADMVNLLADAGADVNGALDVAIAKKAANALQALIAKGANATDARYMMAAIKSNVEASVSALIKAGCDMTYADSRGNNYLHIAAREESDNVVAVLAAAGVKVNEINADKDAPLHIAVTQGRGEVKLVEGFIAAGADVNALNGAGKTPLSITKGARIKSRLKDAGGKEN